MKLVQNTFGRWVQRIAGKARVETPAQPARRPQEVDSRTLTQVSGGDGGSTSTPNKGW
jgi:hypothetical protein